MTSDRRSQDPWPVGRVIAVINPIVRGWVHDFRIGHASRCLTYVKDWVEGKVRRHLGPDKKYLGQNRAQIWVGFGRND